MRTIHLILMAVMGGHTRLIRHALGEGLHYVPLSLRSQEIWESIEKNTDEDSYKRTGVLTFGHSESEVVKTAIEAGEVYDLEKEVFSNGRDMNERFSGLNLPDDYIGIYEPNGGVIDANTVINFFKKRALDLGAELLTDTKVEKIEVITPEQVQVFTKNACYEAEKVIVTVGGHTENLLEKLGKKIASQASRRTVAWFESDEDLYSDETFPGFIGKVDDGYDCYGFPSIKESGVKIGAYNFGHDSHVDDIDFEFGAYDEDENVVRHFLKNYMPGANGELIKGSVCIFQMTPDEQFIIDFHPDYKNMVIASGFAGHGFKFVPVVGEILAQLIEDGRTEYDIDQFSLHRPEIIKES